MSDSQGPPHRLQHRAFASPPPLQILDGLGVRSGELDVLWNSREPFTSRPTHVSRILHQLATSTLRVKPSCASSRSLFGVGAADTPTQCADATTLEYIERRSVLPPKFVRPVLRHAQVPRRCMRWSPDPAGTSLLAHPIPSHSAHPPTPQRDKVKPCYGYQNVWIRGVAC